MNEVVGGLLLTEKAFFFLHGLVALWVFSAAVGAMSPPSESGRKGYQWLYRFLHLLAANLDRAGILNNSSAPAAQAPETTTSN